MWRMGRDGRWWKGSLGYKRERRDRGCRARLGSLDCMFEVGGWCGSVGWGWASRRGRMVGRVGGCRLGEGTTVGNG
jgi:hypothetical protein